MKSIWTPQPGEIPRSSRLAVFEKITAMSSPDSEKSPKRMNLHEPSDQEQFNVKQYRMQKTYSLFGEPESSRSKVFGNNSEIDNSVKYPETSGLGVNYSPPFIRSRSPNDFGDNSVTSTTSTYQSYGEDDSRRHTPEMERYIPINGNPNIYIPRTVSHLLQPQNCDNDFTAEKMRKQSHFESDMTTTFISRPKRYDNTAEQINENSLLYIALTTPMMMKKNEYNITEEQRRAYMSSYSKISETTAYPSQENKYYREDMTVGEMRPLSRRLEFENIENSGNSMDNNILIKTDNAQSPRRKLKSVPWTTGEESNQTIYKFGGDWPAISPPAPKGFKIREGVKEVTELPINTWITGQRPSSFKSCSFCRTNGETPEFFSTHPIRDRSGRVVCPVLRAHVCQTCQATGDDAHTITYCPKVRNSFLGGQPLSTTIALKSSRIKSNGRRRY